MDDFLGDDDMRALFFDVLGKVDSDYERSRVLQSAFDRTEFSPEETVAVLGATRGIHSDYEQGQVLKRIDMGHLSHLPVRDAFFGAVDRLDSDYERSQVLQELLDDAEATLDRLAAEWDSVPIESSTGRLYRRPSPKR